MDVFRGIGAWVNGIIVIEFALEYKCKLAFDKPSAGQCLGHAFALGHSGLPCHGPAAPPLLHAKYLMPKAYPWPPPRTTQQDNRNYTMGFTDMLIMVVVILLIFLSFCYIIHSSCPAWQTMISGTSRRIHAGIYRLLSRTGVRLYTSASDWRDYGVALHALP